MRMDKWLWAARFFKTRALAAKACDLNRITSNGHVAKPAREVREGDSLTIKNEAGEWHSIRPDIWARGISEHTRLIPAIRYKLSPDMP